MIAGEGKRSEIPDRPPAGARTRPVRRCGGGGCGVRRARRAIRVRSVRPDAHRRRAVPSSHAAGRAHRPRRDRALQARLHGIQGRPGDGRSRAAHAARMGDSRQPFRPAARLRAAFQLLRGKPGAGGAAALPAGRLEGRLRAAVDDLRAVFVPRQHRRRADRRHHRPHGVPRQGAYRLPGGDRRRVERGRLGQRGRRHHHHHDVDRWCRSAGRAGGLRCRRRRDADLRRPRLAAAAGLLADHAGRRSRRARRLAARRDRRHHSARRDHRQRDRQREVQRVFGPFPVHRRGSVGRDPHRCAVAQAGVVAAAGRVQRQRVPAFADRVRFADAGGETAGGVVADRARPRLRLRGLRQHPAYRARAQAGRLRLGLSCVCGGLRRLDDLVRFFRRRSAVEHVPAGEIGRPVAQARLARRARLRDRVFRALCRARLASECAAQNQARCRPPNTRRGGLWHDEFALRLLRGRE